MLRIRTGPLLLAALLKPPCCRAFALWTAVGSSPSSSFEPSFAARGRQPTKAGWTMAPKRGHWQRKKEARSRSFAKRGRVGGWGAYGSDQTEEGAAAGASSEEDSTAGVAATAKESAETKPKPKPGNRRNQTRRVETVHAGSYAGELGAMLSEERRQLLKERYEEDEKKAAQQKEEQDEQDKREAPPVTAEGASAEAAPAVGPNGEGGVASSSSKKKVALVISYWGSDYQGLQMNAGAKTIESELELALYLAGSISKDNFGNPRKIGWARAGRTDKGVHAAAQLISAKLTYPNDSEKETIEAINAYLPDDIRVVDIKRAPKSFDGRTRCSGRRYEYIMPTYVLAPKEHIAALFEEALEHEKAQGGSGDGASDIGAGDISSVAGGSIQQLAGGARPSPGGAPGAEDGAALGREAQAAAALGTAAVAPAAAAAGESPEAVGGTPTAPAIASALPAGAIFVGAVGDDDGGEDDKGDSDSDESQAEGRKEDEEKEATLRRAAVELSSPAVIRRVAKKLEGYRLPPDRMEELREILKGFLGTKNYHNYTNHRKATDPSCKRLITSFTAADPFENDGVEWVRLTVGGQSFIMHQIRKMVASTVDRVRGQSSEEDFTRSFFPVKITLGIAPSDGLYLERPLYAPYNSHAKRTGAHDRVLEWETGPAAESLEEFKKNRIHAGILAKEKEDHVFVSWLDRITRYPCTY